MLTELESQILLEIDNKSYPSSISKKLNITYTTTKGYIKKLAESGLVEYKEKRKRVRRVMLTRNGQLVQEQLLLINHILLNNNK